MKIKTLVIVAKLCADHHSGMNSRGYRLLCAVTRGLKRRGINRPLDMPLTGPHFRLLQDLSTKYGRLL